MRSVKSLIAIFAMACFAFVTVQAATATLPDPFEPYSLALDGEGNVYVVAAGNASVMEHIHVYAPDGRKTGTIGDAGWHMEELAFDDHGNLYLRDISVNNNETLKERIKKISPDGHVEIIASVGKDSGRIINGASVNGNGTVCYSEYGLSAEGQYMKDACIYTVGADGRLQTAYAGNDSDGFYCTAIGDDGTIYACQDTGYITVISPGGNVSFIGRDENGHGTLNAIACIAVGRDGCLYTTEYTQGGLDCVRKLRPDGTPVAEWYGCGPDRFVGPHNVAIDDSGKIYVADTHNQRVVWFTGDYRFGNDVVQNMAGEGVLWGTVVAGYNYSTWAGMVDRENRPGLPYALIGIVIFGLAAMGITGAAMARFYRSGKSSSIVVNSAIAGFAVAVFAAAASFFAIVNWWGIVQWFSGLNGWGPVDRYMSAAEGVQLASLIVILPLLAGALAAFLSRRTLRNGRDALLAGTSTGLVALCVFSLCAATIALIQDLTYTNLGVSTGNAIARAPDIFLFVLAIPAFVVLPLCAAGSYLCRRYMARAEMQGIEKGSRTTVKAAAIAGSLAVVALIVARICLNYDMHPLVPALFALPLLATLLALAADLKILSRRGALPAMIVGLALSLVAVAFLPMAEVLAASWLGII